MPQPYISVKPDFPLAHALTHQRRYLLQILRQIQRLHLQQNRLVVFVIATQPTDELLDRTDLRRTHALLERWTRVVEVGLAEGQALAVGTGEALVAKGRVLVPLFLHYQIIIPEYSPRILQEKTTHT